MADARSGRHGLAALWRRDMPGLDREMGVWSRGNWFEQRAAAAALCEPRLLPDCKVATRVLGILDRITGSILRAEDRKSDGFVA